jgi:hypothetical protein
MIMKLLRRIVKRIDRVLSTEQERNSEARVKNFMRIIDKGHGNIKSLTTKKPVNAEGKPIPWFTYPAIEYLNQLDFTRSSILEWGVGNSTLYFANRCKSIVSIEHNKEWYNTIAKDLPVNAKVLLVDENEYATKPHQFSSKFDIIIVDGIKRFDCIKTSVDILKEGGIIIFDNSDRNPEYCQFLRGKNLIQIDFHGFGPIVNFTTTTSIFITRDADFRPLTIQPLVPIGGGY